MISFFSKQGEVRTTNCQLDTGWGMCYKHDECSNWFGGKSLAMFLLQKVSSSGYTLGCYYDPFPPYHLSGDFHHFEANLSVAACVKLCGEDGYMLAGLRWRLSTQTWLCNACFEFHFRDRQYCHCGSVEPPIDLSVGYEMCGDECPPSEWTQEYSADPWAMTMYEPCGKSHYTMVRRPFIKSLRHSHRSIPPPTQTTPSGSAQLMGGQNPDSLVSFPSLRLEGEQFNLSNW